MPKTPEQQLPIKGSPAGELTATEVALVAPSPATRRRKPQLLEDDQVLAMVDAHRRLQELEGDLAGIHGEAVSKIEAARMLVEHRLGERLVELACEALR